MTTLYLAANSTSTLNDVEPGLLGFLVVAALALAVFFLLRSMNKQFRKLGPKPEETEAEGASAAARQRPLRGLAAHRAAMAAAAEADAESSGASSGSASSSTGQADTGQANTGSADARRD